MTRYSCAIGTIGTFTPASAPSSRAYIPPALTTTSVSISPRSVSTACDAAVRRTRIPVTRVAGGDLRPAPPRPLGERERELARVDVAVGGQEGGAEHAVRRHRREERLRLLGRDQLEREAERLRPAGLPRDLLHPLVEEASRSEPTSRQPVSSPTSSSSAR